MTRRAFMMLVLFWPAAAGAVKCYENYVDKHGHRKQREVSCQASSDGKNEPVPAKRDRRAPKAD